LLSISTGTNVLPGSDGLTKCVTDSEWLEIKVFDARLAHNISRRPDNQKG